MPGRRLRRQMFRKPILAHSGWLRRSARLPKGAPTHLCKEPLSHQMRCAGAENVTYWHQRAKLSVDLQITATRRMAGTIATSNGALVLRIVANATAAK